MYTPMTLPTLRRCVAKTPLPLEGWSLQGLTTTRKLLHPRTILVDERPWILAQLILWPQICCCAQSALNARQLDLCFTPRLPCAKKDSSSSSPCPMHSVGRELPLLSALVRLITTRFIR